MSLVRGEEVEEEKEEILSLVCIQTNQDVKSVVFLFLQEKVDIFLVVPLVTSQLQCLAHSLQVSLLSSTISSQPKLLFCWYMYCGVVCDNALNFLYSFFHKRRQSCQY